MIITNDKDYWNEPKKSSLAYNYSLHHDVLNGIDQGWNYPRDMHDKYLLIENRWVEKTNNLKKHWTCMGDLFLDLTRTKDYRIKWDNYSHIKQGHNEFKPINSEFKFLLLKVVKH